MKYETMEMLAELRLSAMKAEYARQCELPAMADLGFDDRFEMIVKAQNDRRKLNGLNRRIKKADLREETAMLKDVDFAPERGISKATIAEYSSMSWVKSGIFMLITGPTGTGKTFFASAFGREACRIGKTVRSYRMNKLLNQLTAARGTALYDQMMQDMASPDLLILDDFGMKVMDNDLSVDFMEMVAERHHEARSILIVSQLPVRRWNVILENRTASDAFMDRITANSYRLVLKGPSRRPRISNDFAWADDEMDGTASDQASAWDDGVNAEED